MGGFENTQENFGNFCREVGEVLCRSWAITHEKFYKPTSGRSLCLQSIWAEGLVPSTKRVSGVGTSYKLLKNRTVKMCQNLCLTISV